MVKDILFEIHIIAYTFIWNM